MHFIGKDITRFHCALWPAMLMAAGVDAAAEGVRPRLRLQQERGDGHCREDQQVARQRRRADGDHHEVQRRGVPLLLPARVPVPRRRRVQLAAVRRGLQRRPGEQPRQPVQPRGDADHQELRRHLPGTAGKTPRPIDRHRSRRPTVQAGARARRGVPVQPGARSASGGRSSTRPTSTPTRTSRGSW